MGLGDKMPIADRYETGLQYFEAWYTCISY